MHCGGGFTGIIPNVKGPRKAFSRSHLNWWVADRQVLLLKGAYMEPANELVYVVDDETSVGEALSALLRANGDRKSVG